MDYADADALKMLQVSALWQFDLLHVSVEDLHVRLECLGNPSVSKAFKWKSTGW